MKNRNFANRTLLCVLILFAAVVVLKIFCGKNFYIDWVMFILEASLVGGIADWFAVTALFKRPLGLPLKATAIIPNNREKVIDAVCGIVENNLFTADGILEKVREADAAGALIRYIDEHDLIDAWSALALARLTDFSSQLDRQRLLSELAEGIKKGLSRLSLSSGVDKIVRWFIGSKGNAQASGFLFDAVIRVVAMPEVGAEISRGLEGAVNSRIGQMKESTGLFARLFYQVASATDCVNTEEAAASLQASLCETLEAMKEPENPVRTQFDALLLDYLQRLETSAEGLELIECLKEEIINNLPIAEELQKLLDDFRDAIMSTAESNRSEEQNLRVEPNLRLDRIKYRVRKLWNSVKQSEILKQEANALIKSLVIGFVRSESKAIGELVRDALSAFSNEKLSDFVQQKVGDDLQWIRVNGSFVGAFVGAALYLFLNLAYLPILQQFR
jgi:uncharacterized membrane-anchored protein YjiN (DUF445 family)